MMQAIRQKSKVHYKVHRWYPKEKDDAIFQVWAEACSEKHNDCLGCPLLKDCQDLVDRLINCMDMPAPGHREIALKH